MSINLKKTNLALVLILVIGLCLPGPVKAAPESSGLYRASFTKKSPSDLSKSVDPLKTKLEWNAASNVFRYVYCYYSSEVPNNVCDINNKATWKSNGTSTSVQLPALVPGKTYYWQVGAKLKDDSFIYADGALSSKWSFTTTPTNVYDDTSSLWVYSGSWTTFKGTGPYNNTLHQSNTAGSYAELTFTGARIKLTYLKAPGRGMINILIDGVLADTIDANSASTLWQQIWISNVLSSGTHTVRFVNVLGGWIDVDAVQVAGLLSAGVYDNTNSNWLYNGTWTSYSGTGPYSNTLSQNSTIGDSADLAFSGARVRLTYLKAPGRGSMDVYIDGLNVATINATDSSILWQQTWTSDILTPGSHSIRLVNTGGVSGNWIDVDAIQIVDLLPAGLYDDNNSSWLFTGSWSTYSGSGPYNNTIHQSGVAGSHAELTFTGVRIKLTYLKAPGRGTISVSIDGVSAGTINANSASTLWQQTWASDILTPGLHTVRFENLSGGWIDLDAIQIMDVLPIGLYDDNNSNWVYGGSWTSYSGTGPYNNTLHQNNTTGNYAELIFEGGRIKLTYLKAPGRGSIKVYIDGLLEDTINANDTSVLWQQTWTSDVLNSNIHTVRFENSSGGWIDLDAVQVLPVGLYDDTDSGWSYPGSWTTFNGSGPYNNTLHQNNTSGEYAELAFTGVRLTLAYLKAPGRGSINVTVDGNPLGTINANSTSTLWQQTWSSDAFTPGAHTARFENASGGWIDLDAVHVYDVLSSGTYDNTNGNWFYSGNWATYSGSGPYKNTLYQNNTAGDYAEVAFTGTRAQLTYLRAPGRGSISISIDGGPATTINANNASVLWQQTWTSPILAAGTHTIRFTNAGGGWIDLDAIQITP